MENLYYNGINIIDLAKRRKHQIYIVVSGHLHSLTVSNPLVYVLLYPSHPWYLFIIYLEYTLEVLSASQVKLESEREYRVWVSVNCIRGNQRSPFRAVNCDAAMGKVCSLHCADMTLLLLGNVTRESQILLNSVAWEL